MPDDENIVKEEDLTESVDFLNERISKLEVILLSLMISGGDFSGDEVRKFIEFAVKNNDIPSYYLNLIEMGGLRARKKKSVDSQIRDINKRHENLYASYEHISKVCDEIKDGYEFLKKSLDVMHSAIVAKNISNSFIDKYLNEIRSNQVLADKDLVKNTRAIDLIQERIKEHASSIERIYNSEKLLASRFEKSASILEKSFYDRVDDVKKYFDVKIDEHKKNSEESLAKVQEELSLCLQRLESEHSTRLQLQDEIEEEKRSLAKVQEELSLCLQRLESEREDRLQIQSEFHEFLFIQSLGVDTSDIKMYRTFPLRVFIDSGDPGPIWNDVKNKVEEAGFVIIDESPP